MKIIFCNICNSDKSLEEVKKNNNLCPDCKLDLSAGLPSEKYEEVSSVEESDASLEKTGDRLEKKGGTLNTIVKSKKDKGTKNNSNYNDKWVIPITTCNTSINYKVIDTIFALDSHREGFFAGAADPSKAFEGVKNQLRQQCTELRGDAVISCQFEYRVAVHDGVFGAKQAIEIFAYGTTTVEITFIINVLVGVINTPPQFTSNPITTPGTPEPVSEDGEYSYTIVTADADSWDNLLSIEATSLPDWLTFDGTATISGTPTNNEVGSYTIVLTLIDAFGTEVIQSFDIIVENTNDAPVFTCIDITEATEDSVYSYTVTASDIDVGNTFTFAATTLPDWLTFDGTAKISGTPTNDNVGANSVVLTVSDGTATVERPFTITVANTNDTPKPFDIIYPSPTTPPIRENDIIFQWQLSEDDDINDMLNYIFYIEGNNSFFSDSISNTNTYLITARELIDLASPSDFTFSSGDLTLDLEWYVACNDNISTTYSDTSTFKLSISNLVLDELEINDIVLPNEYNLFNPYPNPFNPVTVIKYVTPEAGQISISIYDVRGSEIAKLYNGNQMPGSHMLTWDASKHSSGLYFVTMIANHQKDKQAGMYVNTQKLMLIK